MIFNRMNDYYVKYLLGSEKNKAISLNFINAALGNEEEYFTDISFENKDQEPEHEGGKETRLDIKGVLNTGVFIELEVQVTLDKFMAERSLYYWSRMYGNQLAEGDAYNTLKKAIAINILNFKFLPENSWINTYEVTNTISRKALSDHLRIMFLELPKLKKYLEADFKGLSNIAQWGAYFYRLVDDKKMEEIPVLAEALNKERQFTADKQQMYWYEMHEKAVRDRISLVEQYMEQVNEAKAEAAEAKEEANKAKEEAAVAKAEAKAEVAKAKEEKLVPLFELVSDGYITIAKAAEKAHMSELDFETAMTAFNKLK